MAIYIISVVQLAILITILVVLLLRGRGTSDDLVVRFGELRTLLDRLEPSLRDEVRAFRSEVAEQAQQFRREAGADSRSLREELLSTVKMFGGQVTEAVGESRREQALAAVQLRESVQASLVALGGELRDSF